MSMIMKKILLAFLICLITILPGLSQKLSPNKSKDCVVPCESLRKALINKEDKTLLENKLVIVKDSITILNEVVSLQINLIDNKEKIIESLVSSQELQVNVIIEKDKQISHYKKMVRKQKIYKFIGFTTSTLGVVAVVLILL